VSFVWLFVWIVAGAPVFIHGRHESWLIGLVVCFAIDVLTAGRHANQGETK
jgi:hypothetical protein